MGCCMFLDRLLLCLYLIRRGIYYRHKRRSLKIPVEFLKFRPSEKNYDALFATSLYMELPILATEVTLVKYWKHNFRLLPQPGCPLLQYRHQISEAHEAPHLVINSWDLIALDPRKWLFQTFNKVFNASFSWKF